MDFDRFTDTKPNNCIYFQEAIGGRFIIDRVCKSCNDRLGAKVDGPLADHPAVVEPRHRLRIPAKKGEVPDAFSRLLGSTIGIMVKDPEQRIRLEKDPITGSLKPRILYRATRTRMTDGTEQVQIQIDEDDSEEIGKILNRERKRASLPSPTESELQDQINSILANNCATIGIRRYFTGFQ